MHHGLHRPCSPPVTDMKKCIVISDSFKGTLSSLEICRIARSTIPTFFPECQVVGIPVADGGEGTVSCFMEAVGAIPVAVTVQGPFGQPLSAVYGRKGSMAVIEMAAAAGLPLVGSRKAPGIASTYGVGQLIRHAVKHGAREILLGLGGSATNDGGCGCAAALGVDFFDRAGTRFVPTGNTLDQICRIDMTACRTLLEHIRITAMCDVTSPLYGPEGAAYVFAPQKGASPEEVARLDGQLKALDQRLQQELGRSYAQLPGAGAAGGMGAGCIAFLGAELKSGIEAVLDAVSFDRQLEGTDLVITGEGRIDGQSLQGKVISGIARRTSARGIPLLAITGGIDSSASAVYEQGVTAMFSINREPAPLSASAPHSAENYRSTLEDICRLIRTAASFKA